MPDDRHRPTAPVLDLGPITGAAHALKDAHMAARLLALVATALAGLLAVTPALAQTVRGAKGVDVEAESPWLVLPMFSVDPKLGTSLGVMGGYMPHFDERSRLSCSRRTRNTPPRA